MNKEERQAEEHLLKTGGWRIFEKLDNGKNFYESPYDRRVYLQSHAVRIEEAKREEAAELAAKAKDLKDQEDWVKACDWTLSVEEMFQGEPKEVPKKLKTKSKKAMTKKAEVAAKRPVEEIMKELGFR